MLGSELGNRGWAWTGGPIGQVAKSHSPCYFQTVRASLQKIKKMFQRYVIWGRFTQILTPWLIAWFAGTERSEQTMPAFRRNVRVVCGRATLSSQPYHGISMPLSAPFYYNRHGLRGHPLSLLRRDSGEARRHPEVFYRDRNSG